MQIMSAGDVNQLLRIAEYNFHINNYEFSETALYQVLKIDTHNSRAYELLAYIHGSRGNLDQAYKFLICASQEKGCSGEALYELGSIYLDSGRPEQAKTCFINSLEKSGDFFEALHDLGTAQAQLGILHEALISYSKALAIRNDVPEIFFNLGRLYDELRNSKLALENYSEALRLQPNYANAWRNKGATLCDLKRFDEALFCYQNAFGLDPEISFILGDITHLNMQNCEWHGLEDIQIKIRKEINLGNNAISPFALLSLIDDPALQKKCAELCTQRKYPFNPILGSIPKYSQRGNIRIGYFSADFGNHAVSILMAEIFELHDKSQFEIIAFSLDARDVSPMRSSLEKVFTKFIDVSHLTDQDIAKLARELEIDVAVDLGGFTANNRTAIFSYRAAPIQVSYIGYLGTMGASYIDYLISDRVIIPEEYREFYSEKISYIPSFQANDSRRKISNKIFSRGSLGLPKSGFVFACFNNNYKILPTMFDSWMRILQSTPGSVLFLYADNDRAKKNLINSAIHKGISKDRIIFGIRLPPDEYLARYQLCDLFLDTSPYNAGTTASDALWAGLPVLTLTGQSFASRVATSLLIAVDMPELITSTTNEYEALAIELATNPQKLSSIKKKLENNRLSTPLFDSTMFTKSLESAYKKMMGRYWSDLLPDHIQDGITTEH